MAPASVRASEQMVGSGWWWVVVLGDGWWVLVGVGWYFSFRQPYAVSFLLAQLLLKCIDGLPGDQLLNTISQGIVSSR